MAQETILLGQPYHANVLELLERFNGCNKTYASNEKTQADIAYLISEIFGYYLAQESFEEQTSEPKKKRRSLLTRSASLPTFKKIEAFKKSLNDSALEGIRMMAKINTDVIEIGSTQENNPYIQDAITASKIDSKFVSSHLPSGINVKISFEKDEYRLQIKI